MRVLSAGLFICAAWGQMFEVASIKPSPPPDGRGIRVRVDGGPGSKDPTRLTLENVALAGMVQMAYGIDDYQLSAPDWMKTTRFVLTAKVPEGATKEQMELMMRNLLIERFKLQAHVERKEVAGAYQLVVSKSGPKLTKSAGEPEEDAVRPGRFTLDKDGYPEPPPGRGDWMAMGRGKARWRMANWGMEQFAKGLADQLGAPVVDATGLKGKYDILISWSPEAMRADAPEDAGPSLFTAVQRLWLKLESKKTPMDVVVVDHMEKTPTEN